VLANDVRVVPEHVFAHVHHVARWLNPHPVGTGPFAVVGRFGSQAYVLERNPHYWRRGLPRFPCIERVASATVESATYQAVNGDIDLTNDYVPHVERVYVAHDPAHFHYFYPANTSPGIGLFFDDTAYPFSIVALRKAISLAVDRRRLALLGENGYTPTVDALGINRVWPQWMSEDVAADARALATYDPGAARRMLLAAGFTYDGTTLLDPKGDPVVIDAIVIAGWVDWYTDWHLIAADLGRIGIKVNIDPRLNFDAWFRDASATRKATLLWQTAGDTESPYDYFKEHLDASSFVPSGHEAGRTGNWEHFQNAEATRLLARFRATDDLAVQHRIAGRLERLFLDNLPFVPLFAAPDWSTYSTRHFVGFPSARDSYVQPDFGLADYVVALTRIRPRP
jgi:peptide/nickel transport system substrate-binding protein